MVTFCSELLKEDYLESLGILYLKEQLNASLALLLCLKNRNIFCTFLVVRLSAFCLWRKIYANTV